MRGVGKGEGDERVLEGFGGTVTGGSLGIRTGGYGSLQQQVYSCGAMPYNSPPLVVHKLSRISISGSREKEKFLPSICKVFGRRKFWMLLLFVASVAVLSSFSILSTEEYASENQNILKGDLVWSIKTSDRLSFSSPLKDKEVNSTLEHPLTVNNIQDPTIVPPVLSSKIHPCQSFKYFPPPADKRHIGPRPCPVCYAPLELAIALMPSSPSASPVLKNLSYLSEEESAYDLNEGSMFGGHPSLLQRNDSFDIKESMSVHCGFLKGKNPGQGSGFDIEGTSLLEMEGCHGVVVASAIFGNYDLIQQPKNISEYSKQNACFYMFIDEETEAYIKNSISLDSISRIGLWRVVVVRNLPFADARRNGKVPKLLLHRLFPNARYSVWIDGKLELVVDPYLVLERFLWRTNSTFAISRHYRRFDVFDEAEANKAAGKYDNASIDNQIEFYEKEGLTHYSPAKLPFTSDVPEGCVIIREHIPITNLFTCLWFNEVDRFTSRDQLSFSTVRDKIISRVNWTINMFMDCERRNFVVQAYHKDLLEQRKALASLRNQHSAMTTNNTPGLDRPAISSSRKFPEKISMKRGKDRKSNSRRHSPKTDTGRKSKLRRRF